MTPVKPTQDAWRISNAEWLTLRLDRLHLLFDRRSLWLHREGVASVRPADWILSRESAADEIHFFATAPDVLAVDESIRNLQRQYIDLESRMRQESHAPALSSLSELVGLSPFEEDLLLLSAAPGLDSAFKRACAELHDDPRRDYSTLHLALALFVDNPADRVLAMDTVMPSRHLRSLQLIEIHDNRDNPRLTSQISVDERITDFLRGVNRVDSRIEPYLQDVPSTVPVDSITRTANRLATIIRGEPDRWTTINLIGSPQHGARDVAALASAELGIRLRSIDIARQATTPLDDQQLLITLLGREALLGGFAVLVETDNYEPTSPEARLVDDLVARLPATLFLISTERWRSGRNVYAINVDRLTPSDRATIWQAALAPHVHSVNGEVDAIIQQFAFGSAAIVDVVERARRRSDGAITSQSLWRACREQQGTALDQLARRIDPSYEWDDLIVNDVLRVQLEELSDQVRQRSHVYETWGFGVQLGRGRGITALFAGPSGTGKTMAAELLAARLDLNLYRIDLSGVVSKYVGETEKNLRRVFDAAEDSGAILLFDEADSLFGTRTEGRDSHDRYMNLEINYLLQRMEDYTGLAILATNRRSALDQAFLRRLRFVMEFPFPSIEERRRIWERVFPDKAELGDLDLTFLADLEITGGNIRSIAINAAFLAASDNQPIGMPHIARAASREFAKLSKPVSAADFGPYYELVRS